MTPKKRGFQKGFFFAEILPIISLGVLEVVGAPLDRVLHPTSFSSHTNPSLKTGGPRILAFLKQPFMAIKKISEKIRGPPPNGLSGGGPCSTKKKPADYGEGVSIF